MFVLFTVHKLLLTDTTFDLKNALVYAEMNK